MMKCIASKKPVTLGALSACLSGLLTHLFGLVNILHNHDDINIQPNGYGTGITSGRWFLDDLGQKMQSWFGGYDLHWINGLLLIGFVALSVGFFIAVFDIKGRKCAVLIGLIFPTFPAVTDTMFYRFTAGYYGFAVFLAVLAAWFLVKVKWGIIFSALCSAFALGIYQAYLPITIAILVLFLIQQALRCEDKAWHILVRGVYFCAGLLLGVLLYVCILRLRLWQNHLELSNYQGINAMGQIQLTQLPRMFLDAYKSFFLMPVNGYGSLSQTVILRYCYIGTGLFTVAIACITTIAKRPKFDQILVLVALCLVFPLAVNFIVIMCPDSDFRTMLLYAFVVVPCTPLVLVDGLPQFTGIKEKCKHGFEKIVAVCILLIVISNAYLANVNYTQQYYANRQTENYFTSLVTQIRMTKGYTKDHKLAFIGTQGAMLVNNPWQNVPMYGGNRTSDILTGCWSFPKWWKNYCGYTYASATSEEIKQLILLQEVQDMPCWPDEGSIKVINNFVVLKFEEIS